MGLGFRFVLGSLWGVACVALGFLIGLPPVSLVLVVGSAAWLLTRRPRRVAQALGVVFGGMVLAITAVAVIADVAGSVR